MLMILMLMMMLMVIVIAIKMVMMHSKAVSSDFNDVADDKADHMLWNGNFDRNYDISNGNYFMGKF